MAKLTFLLFPLMISVAKINISSSDETPLTITSQQKPYKRLTIMSRLYDDDLEDEFNTLTNRFGWKAVVITNEARDFFTTTCFSAYDQVFLHKFMEVGRSVLFKYFPKVSEFTPNFQCSVDYKGFAAVWDATNDLMPYVERNDTVYHYFVRHDGVYINGRKIQGLVSSENRYLLCKENFVRRFHPDCLPGYVDEGVCNNLPSWILDKVSSVTMSDYGCIILYDDYNCSGNSKEIKLTSQGQQRNNLVDFKNQTVSVKGCAAF